MITIFGIKGLLPHALHINKAHKIIVASSNDYDSITLHTFSSDASSELERISFKFKNKCFTMTLTQTSQGSYVVATGDNIVCIGRNGDRIWDHQFQGRYIIAPMLCDNADNILVGHLLKVIRLDSNGYNLADLLLQQSGIITAMKFINNETLVTLNNDGTVSFLVYKIGSQLV